MKNINTLIEDMYHVLSEDMDYQGALDTPVLGRFGARCVSHVRETLATRTTTRGLKVLRSSELGEGCLRKIWFKFHEPEQAEVTPPYAHMKFLYGDIVEEMTLLLAEAAGHTVTNRQDVIETPLVDGFVMRGHIDCIIDGHMIDVKSMSSPGFAKVPQDLAKYEDPFGYRWQVASYNALHEEVVPENYPGLLCVDKQLGHIKLSLDSESPTPKQVVDKANLMVQHLSKPEFAVPKGYSPVPHGKSGNMMLPIQCSYCPFKKRCYSTCGGYRTFSYSTGPVYLTTVVNEPNVLEIT